MFDFNINNSTWKVIEKEKKELLDKYNKEHEDEATFVFGLTSYSNHEIWINEEMCIEQKINTLKHELTHCYIWSYGLYNAPHYTDEMVCDIVSSINDFINEVVTKYKEALDQEKEKK